MAMHIDVGSIIETVVAGVYIRFFVKDKDDVIQNHHFRGKFYEEEELKIIERRFIKGSVFVDIGCNVGNHAIYVSKFLKPKCIILFEPNGNALDILRVNIDINKLTQKTDVFLFEFGVAEKAKLAVPVARYDHNLGATQMAPIDEFSSYDGREVILLPGDKVLSTCHVDFIKIDVEGGELDVLAGLKDTINRDRPQIFVEVDDANDIAFRQWAAEHRYEILEQYQRYESQINYMMGPAEKLTI
jgi:FkbM family methyltransferase